MNTIRRRPSRLSRLLAPLALLAGAVGLTGCSVVDAVFYQQQTSTYDSVAALEAEGTTTADWLPADGTAITVTSSTKNSTASLLIGTLAPLDETLCTEVDRQSAPSYEIPGSPDAYAADTVFACGEWSVIPAANGWYGWTPNHPDEREAAVAG